MHKHLAQPEPRAQRCRPENLTPHRPESHAGGLGTSYPRVVSPRRHIAAIAEPSSFVPGHPFDVESSKPGAVLSAGPAPSAVQGVFFSGQSSAAVQALPPMVRRCHRHTVDYVVCCSGVLRVLQITCTGTAADCMRASADCMLAAADCMLQIAFAVAAADCMPAQLRMPSVRALHAVDAMRMQCPVCWAHSWAHVLGDSHACAVKLMRPRWLQEERPGVRDDTNFRQHWSVSEWRSWNWPPKDVGLSSPAQLQALARAVRSSAQQANMLEDSTSAAYWAYHVTRTSYFALQAALSVIVHSAVSGSLREGKTGFTDSPVPLGQYFERMALVRRPQSTCVWGICVVPQSWYLRVALAAAGAANRCAGRCSMRC